MMFNGVFYGVYLASVYKAANIDNLKDGTLTIAGAIGSICNGGSRMFWASLQDKYNFKRVYFVLLVIQLVVSIIIYPIRAHAGAYVFCVALSFLCEGGQFSMFPTVAVKIFGVHNGGQIFTIMFFCVSLSSNFGLLMDTYVKPHVGVQNIFWLGSLLTLTNIILLFWLNEKPLKPRAVKGEA